MNMAFSLVLVAYVVAYVVASVVAQSVCGRFIYPQRKA
jgi:hypothetical protein